MTVPMHRGWPSTSDDWVSQEAHDSERFAEPCPRFTDRYGIEVTLGDVVDDGGWS